jgi:mono/diheme cytochrome c family protein
MAQGRYCPSCGANTLPQARFCHACGARQAARAGGWKTWPAGRLAAIGMMAGLVVAGAVVAVFSGRGSAPPSFPALPAPAGQPARVASPGGAPDISQLTPREAADRLFNRVMASNEEGNLAEARRFAPMAIEAYASLPALDRDAHYHLALIHGVTGDRAMYDQQIAALRLGAPNHLLALALEHDAAEKSGDRAAVERTRAAFAAAYDGEIVQARPEYEAHLNAIEKLRALAPAAASAPAARGQEAPAVYAEKCAICHGPAASGTDKGPPLVHKVFEPSHHNDESFRRAVLQGTAQHHWTFGPMLPVPGVSNRQIEEIIAYVRDLQRAAGIR